MVSGICPQSGRRLEIEVNAGVISSVREAPGAAGDLWVAPGLIDLQVNGFGGVDYNGPDTGVEDLADSIRQLRATGVTRFFPTVITGPPEAMRGALRNLARARQVLAEGASIAGFHLEGPFLSPDEGPRGAHPREHVRPPDGEEFLRLQEAAGGGIRLVTLAPELPGAMPLIESLVRQGVVVGLGHTAASGQQIRDAIRAGAVLSTHLGNGCHSTLPRHPNYIWEQMAADELYASLIVDGIHLPPSFVKCAVRAKGLDRIVLVTDATSPANCRPGRYRLGDLEVELTSEQRVRIAGTDRLAGSALRMDRGVENLIRFAGLTLEQALRAATVNPARVAGLSHRTRFLAPGEAADLILFRWDAEAGRVMVEQTLIGEP